jgi:hypothetical protein
LPHVHNPLFPHRSILPGNSIWRIKNLKMVRNSFGPELSSVGASAFKNRRFIYGYLDVTHAKALYN